MAKFTFNWQAKVEYEVEIEASTMEEAYEKWNAGEHDKPEIQDEDLYDNIVEIDGKLYSAVRFLKL